jgi:beta-lactamase regulating signal transducer with metallopeptidase domain
MMLLAWMGYSMLLGAIAYAAAYALDHFAGAANIPRRFFWAGALVCVAIAPVVFATRVQPTEVAASTAPRPSADATIGAATPLSPTLVARATARAGISAESIARAVWLALSLGYLALIARAAISVHRRSRRWPSVQLDETRVLVAADVGPAVVGAIQPRIVIPQWTLSLEPNARSLMLLHETEHVRARDPLLLFGATLALVVFPWNPMLWALVARLRLAIEIDCDRRVLRAADQPLEYGRLLLMVSARPALRIPLAASLTERRSLLERRITAMTSATPRHPRLLSTACISIALVAVTAAARAPRPAPFPRSASSAPHAPAPVATPTPPVSPPQATPRVVAVAKPVAPVVVRVNQPIVVRANVDTLTMSQIRQMIADHQAAALVGDPGSTKITLVVDANGAYVTSLAEAGTISIELSHGGAGGAGGGRGARGGGGADAIAGSNRAELRARGSLVSDSAGTMHVEVTKRPESFPRYMIDYVAKETGLRDVRLDMPGFNQAALGTLIDLSAAESVRLRTFHPGEIGSGSLYVYVVRLRH